MPVGFSSTSMPREQSTTSMSRLRLPRTMASAHPSSPSPTFRKTLARATLTMWLGRTSTECGLDSDLASEKASTRLPPTAVAMEARSGTEAATVTVAPVRPAERARIAKSERTMRFMFGSP